MRFHLTSARPSGRLVKGKESIQYTRQPEEPKQHTLWLVRRPVGVGLVQQQPAVTRPVLGHRLFSLDFPDVGTLPFYHAGKECLRPRSVLWVV